MVRNLFYINIKIMCQESLICILFKDHTHIYTKIRERERERERESERERETEREIEK
jgi:hypothetical protein